MIATLEKTMDLDDLRVIWDKQTDQPLYVLDQQALHDNVRKRVAKINKSVDVFEFVMMGVLVFVGFMAISKRFLTSETLDLIDWWVMVTIVVVVVIAVFWIAKTRVRRFRLEGDFPATIAGDLDKAIFQLNYQGSRLKLFHFWFALPMALIMTLNLTNSNLGFADLASATTIKSVAMYLLSLVVCYGSIWFETRWANEPSRDGLISLRNKLCSVSE